MKLVKIGALLFFIAMVSLCSTHRVEGQAATEAPAGFDAEEIDPNDPATNDQGNGMVTPQQHIADKEAFNALEKISTGLGPVYNAQACGECHQNPRTGAISQIDELRAGHSDSGGFVEPPGGSLIQARAIDPQIQERLEESQGFNIRTFRTSLNTLGDGFVEAVDDGAIINISFSQQSQDPLIRGQFIGVEVREAPGNFRIGRFGWKDSIASLMEFSAAAYQAEVGITSPLFPTEQTSLGNSVAAFDKVADPEDTGGAQGFGEDVEAFARFMRATKAPPRDRVLVPDDSVDPGSALFNSIGCAICHVRSLTTMPAGTQINGGTFTIPPALGNKIIHPFSDFLLHNIGTGDGIVETNGNLTTNRVRTAPLWGLRTRNRLMHDGGGSSSSPSNNGTQSFTLNEAILRHAGEATNVRNNYTALTTTQKDQLIKFLKSL